MKKHEKSTKLHLSKETVAQLHTEVASGALLNDTVYRPRTTDWYYCSANCPIDA